MSGSIIHERIEEPSGAEAVHDAALSTFPDADVRAPRHPAAIGHSAESAPAEGFAQATVTALGRPEPRAIAGRLSVQVLENRIQHFADSPAH